MCPRSNKGAVETTTLIIHCMNVITIEQGPIVQLLNENGVEELLVGRPLDKLIFRFVQGVDIVNNVEFTNIVERSSVWVEDFYGKLLTHRKVKIRCFRTSARKPAILTGYWGWITIPRVTIRLTSTEEIRNWLNILNVDDLTIEGNYPAPARTERRLLGLGSHRAVEQARVLRITQFNDIDDDQLEELNCDELHLYKMVDNDFYPDSSRITSDGIVRLIEKMDTHDYPINANFTIAIRDFDINAILSEFDIHDYRNYDDGRTAVLVPTDIGKQANIQWTNKMVRIFIEPRVRRRPPCNTDETEETNNEAQHDSQN